MKIYRDLIKPTLDFVLALFLLTILSPIFVLTYFGIMISMGKPVIFRQARPGYKGKIFHIYKFRTMTNQKDKDGNLLSDEQRLTRLGKLIRSLSLDELPQLINIIKGNMSFIGPRPLLPEYLEIYNNFQKKRHDVRPGISGWAQINGRNQISWESKFKFDVWYVENQSFILDVKIACLTVYKVLKRSDINQSANSTMEKFNGTN